MRKIAFISIAAAVLLSISSAKSQDVGFGVKGGYSLNTFTGDDGMYDLKSGYAAGIFVQYNLSEELGVRVEPAYSIKGASGIEPLYLYESGSPLLLHYFLDGTSIAYDKHDIITTSVEIPLLLSYRLSAGGFGLQFSAGPVWDILLKAENKKTREAIVGSESYGEITSTDDITDRFMYNDIGAQVGIGIGLPIDPLDVSVELRYRHGFNNINNVESKPDLTTNSFGVHVLVGLDGLFF